MSITDTQYPIVVSMSGAEWDSLIKNLGEDEELDTEILYSLRSKRIIVPTRDEQYRLSDPVADIVRIVSGSEATVSIECPSARRNESTVFMFFHEGDHVLATRKGDDSRLDFLLAELGESPLSTFLKLASEIRIDGDCDAACYVDETPADFSFSEEEPFVRISFEREGTEGGVCALFARKDGGAWLLQGDTEHDRVILRCGDCQHILACISDFLEEMIEKVLRI